MSAREGSDEPAWQLRSPAEPLRSAGEAGEERVQLGDDGVDYAVEDADDGGREAARNLRTGEHCYFFLGIDH